MAPSPLPKSTRCCLLTGGAFALKAPLPWLRRPPAEKSASSFCGAVRTNHAPRPVRTWMKDEASVKYITALAAKSEFVTAVTGGESLPPQSTHPNNAGEAVRDASAALSRTSISDGTLAIHPSRLITAMMNMTTGARAGRVQAALADDGRTESRCRARMSRTQVSRTALFQGSHAWCAAASSPRRGHLQYGTVPKAVRGSAGGAGNAGCNLQCRRGVPARSLPTREVEAHGCSRCRVTKRTRARVSMSCSLLIACLCMRVAANWLNYETVWATVLHRGRARLQCLHTWYTRCSHPEHAVEHAVWHGQL